MNSIEPNLEDDPVVAGRQLGIKSGRSRLIIRERYDRLLRLLPRLWKGDAEARKEARAIYARARRDGHIS